jgi:hypothetical protein
MGEMRNTYKISIRKPEGERPRGRHRRSWENEIRMDLEEIRWGIMDWVHIVQGRDKRRALVNTVMNLPVPQKAVNFLAS